jgi:outer membrane protein
MLSTPGAGGMMVKSLGLLVMSLLFSSMLFGQELKIGVVNSELVMQSYPEFQRAEEKLGREVEVWQGERAGWEKQMQAMQQDIIDRERKLQAGQTTFSENRKQELQAQIDSLKITYQQNIQEQMAAEQERYNQRRMELLAEVLEVVNKTIEEIGEAEGYDIILDGSNGTVVYAKEPNDITDILLNKLEKK